MQESTYAQKRLSKNEQEYVTEAQGLDSLFMTGYCACSILVRNLARNQATGCEDITLLQSRS